jgi:type II secretion system protein N
VVKKVIRWFLVSLGYLLYTLGVTVILLWLLYPADTVKIWLQRKLHMISPSLVWEIDDMKAAFPLQLRVSDIRVYRKNQTDSPLVEVADLQLLPDIRELVKLKKRIPLSYRLKTLDGTVRGRFLVSENRAGLECSGTLQDIQVGRLEEFWRKAGRTGSGKLSGTFVYKGGWRQPLRGDLKADLIVADGRISLVQSTLGLDVLEFSTMRAAVTAKDRIVNVNDGQLDSRLFSADFTGVMSLSDSFSTSGIKVQGFVEPRPELFGRLGNDAAITLIKSQLQGGRLSFAVSGSLAEPGILFKGSSGVIDGIFEGSLR